MSNINNNQSQHNNYNNIIIPNISDKQIPDELKLLIDEYDLAKKSDEKQLLQDKIYKIFKDTSKFIDQSIIDKIYSTPEFLLNKSYFKYIKPVNFNTFTLSNPQLFLKKIFSPDTNINGMLLMHQTGSGKTCSALQIANNFKEVNHVYNKKTIIISFHDSIFKTELFDIRKYKDGYMKQCMETEILDNIIASKDKSSDPEAYISQYKDEIKRAANRYINTKYFFKGYIAFYKYIQRKFTNEGKEEDYNLTKIINEFSNRIIIIDEIQHLRESMTSGANSKQIIDVLRIIMKYGKNNKIIFLSATPMFNNYSEISLIMELLLLNDDIQDKSKYHVEINKNGDLDELSVKNLQYFANNYVSYVRGFNPYIYPVKLYPNVFNYSKILDPTNYPKYDITHNKINKEQQIKNLILIGSELSTLQKQLYSKFLKIKLVKGGAGAGDGDDDSDNNNSVELPKVSDSKSNSVELPEVSDSNNTNNNISNEYMEHMLSFDDDDNIDDNTKKQIILLQNYSNITYPNSLDILKENSVSSLSITKFFTYNHKENYYSYSSEFNKPDKYFLNSQNLVKYSPKISTIIENIQNSDGIVLVYSRLLEYGIIPLALALEHLGFNFCNNGLFNRKLLDPSLKNEKGETINSNGLHYTIISGDSRFSLNNKKSIELATNEDNKNGTKIKVIIISETGTEGFDFKNIREIHILEPWYNLNKIEQINGRGIRFKSHQFLPEEKHNCMIFQHISLLQPVNKKQTIESIDFRNYRISENKQYYISKVESILKSYALDCNINQEILIYNKSLNLKKNLVLSKFIDNKKDKFILNNEDLQNNNFDNLIKLDDFPLYDKDYSKECDYKECAINCFPKFNIEEIIQKNELSKLSIITYDINNYIKYITYIFKDKIIFNYDEIKNELNEFTTVHEKILQLALNKMIKDKIKLSIKLHYTELNEIAKKVSNINNNTQFNDIIRYKVIDGYLIIKNITQNDENILYYIFQPFNIEDEKILLKERKLLPDKLYYSENKGIEINLLNKYINNTNNKLNNDNGNTKKSTIFHKYKNEYKEIIKDFHNKYLEYYKYVSVLFPKPTISPLIIIYMILQTLSIKNFIHFVNIFNYIYKKFKGKKIDDISISEFSSNESDKYNDESLLYFIFEEDKDKINIKSKLRNIIKNLHNIFIIFQYIPHTYIHKNQVVSIYFELQLRTNIKKGQLTQKKFEYYLFQNNNKHNIFTIDNPSREIYANTYNIFMNKYTKLFLNSKNNFGNTEKAFYIIDIETQKQNDKFSSNKVYKTIRDETVDKNKGGDEIRTLKNYAEAGVLGGLCKTQNKIPKLKELVNNIINEIFKNITMPKISTSEYKQITKIVGGKNNNNSSSIQLPSASSNNSVQLPSISDNNNKEFNFDFNKKKDISFNTLKLIQHNIIQLNNLDKDDLKYKSLSQILDNMTKNKKKNNKDSLCTIYEYLLNLATFIDSDKLWIASSNILHYYISNLDELNRSHGFSINKK